MFHYFPFTFVTNFTGSYSHYNSTSFIIPSGSVCNPSDILKLNSGTNSWSQIPTTVQFLNNTLEITSLNGTDWTSNLKNEWFNSYLSFIGLETKLTPSEKTTLFNHIELLDTFQLISTPSIAYVNKNDGTNSPIIDKYLSNEISIGLNVYNYPVIMNYANTLPNNTLLKNKIYINHKLGKIYISNVCKVKYNGFEKYVWCFDGIEYSNYDISGIGLIPSLSNGGGNVFGEVKLAGNYIQAHYIVKKNIDKKDPTVGLCSGIFVNSTSGACTGELIYIIDTTTRTFNGTGGWSWIGDFSQVPIIWHVADVSHACSDYSNVPISSMLFPLRIIQFCQFLNFG